MFRTKSVIKTSYQYIQVKWMLNVTSIKSFSEANFKLLDLLTISIGPRLLTTRDATRPFVNTRPSNRRDSPDHLTMLIKKSDSYQHVPSTTSRDAA